MDSDPGLSFQCLVLPVSSAFLVCDVGMSVLHCMAFIGSA